MHGRLIVGEGRAPENAEEERPARAISDARRYVGIDLVLSVNSRAGRIVIDHDEIEGFMAPMVMSYQVSPPSLLDGLNAGETIEFTIDAGQRAIVDIVSFE